MFNFFRKKVNIDDPMVLFKKGEFSKALSMVNEMINITPNVSIFYRLKGECLVHLCRFTEAAESFMLAKKCDVKHEFADTAAWSMYSFFSAGNAEKAIEIFGTVMKVKTQPRTKRNIVKNS